MKEEGKIGRKKVGERVGARAKIYTVNFLLGELAAAPRREGHPTQRGPRLSSHTSSRSGRASAPLPSPSHPPVLGSVMIGTAPVRLSAIAVSHVMTL